MLLPAAAFAVHQLRYELAYGSRSGAALTAQGHGYLDSLAPWVVRAARARARLVPRSRARRPARARATRRRGARFAALWALVVGRAASRSTRSRSGSRACSRPGIPAGFAGVFGHGGWWALPLAVAFGARRRAAAARRLGRRRDGRAVRGAPAAAALISGLSRPAEAPSVRRAVLAGLRGPGAARNVARGPLLAAASNVPTARKESPCGPRRLRTVVPVVLAALALPAQAAAHGRAATIALDYRLALDPRRDAPGRARPRARRRPRLPGPRRPGHRARRARGAAGAAAPDRLDRRLGERELADRDRATSSSRRPSAAGCT